MCKLLIVALSFTVVGCLSRTNTKQFINLSPPKNKEDIGIRNPLNFDNIVFKSGSVFDYKVNFQDSSGNKYRLAIESSGQIKPDSLILIKHKKSLKKNKSAYSIDRIQLIVDSTTNASQRLAKSQSLIRYKYIQNHSQPFPLFETTGIVEDSTRIFLHPPRSFHFELLELCPFPQVYFPLEIGKKWVGKLKIPEFWFIYHKSLDKAIEIENYYEVVSIVELSFNRKNYYCYKIIGRGTSELGDSFSTFYFNPELGFIRFEAIDTNKNMFQLSLISKS